MTNAWYSKAKQKLAEAQINWTADTIKVYLIDTGAYTPNLSTHEFLSDIPGGAIIAEATLTGKSNALGVLDAADVSIGSVSGATVEALVFAKFTGTNGTSPLLLYFDTGTGLPFTPNTGGVNIVWDNGANKIASI